MSRVIKFRAWDTKTGARLYDLLLDEDGYVRELVSQPYMGDHLSYADAIIEQFTGLHDKHGKEIYEGDIVETCNLSGKPQPCVVEWDVNVWIVRGLDRSITGLHSNWCSSPKFGVTTIGNIHENPELLEGK